VKHPSENTEEDTINTVKYWMFCCFVIYLSNILVSFLPFVKKKKKEKEEEEATPT